MHGRDWRAVKAKYEVLLPYARTRLDVNYIIGEMISEVQGTEYEPWFTPVAEVILNGEIPGEIESLIFCLQTGIGVGVLFFFFGRFYERKKLGKEDQEI